MFSMKLKAFPSILSLLRVFILNMCLILSNVFFLYRLIRSGDLTSFSNINHQLLSDTLWWQLSFRLPVHNQVDFSKRLGTKYNLIWMLGVYLGWIYTQAIFLLGAGVFPAGILLAGTFQNTSQWKFCLSYFLYLLFQEHQVIRPHSVIYTAGVLSLVTRSFTSTVLHQLYNLNSMMLHYFE